MNASARVLEPKLAYDLWQSLMKLSDLLWECYDKDFLEMEGEKQGDLAKDLESEIEIPF
jgi:hypothetical protein